MHQCHRQLSTDPGPCLLIMSCSCRALCSAALKRNEIFLKSNCLLPPSLFQTELAAHGTVSSLIPRSTPTSHSTTWSSIPWCCACSNFAGWRPESVLSVSPIAIRLSSQKRLFLFKTRRSCIISLNSPACTLCTPTSPPLLFPVVVRNTASSVSLFTKTFPEHWSC